MNDRLRVAMFPYGNDGNPYQKNLRRAFEKAGCDVLTVARAGRFVGFRQLADLPVDVIHNDWLSGVYRGASLASTVPKVAATLTSLSAVSAPLAMTIHNIEPHEPPKCPRLDRLAERGLVNRMSGFVHFSDRGSAAWAERFPLTTSRPYTTIRHGHYVDDYVNQVSRAEARASLGFQSDSTKLLLCFGAIRRYKGHFQFAESFLKFAPPGYKLLIAGAPYDSAETLRLEQLSARSGGRIAVEAKWIANDDVQTYMNAADIGVAPFAKVNSSGSVLLMQSFGLPVGIPNLGVLEEYAAGGRALVYDTSQVDRLFEEISAFLDSVSIDRAEAICSVRERHSWWPVGEVLASFYSSIANQSERSAEQSVR